MSLRSTITNASYKGYQSVGSGGGPTGSWAFFQSDSPYKWQGAKFANNSQYMAVQYSLNNLVTVLDNSTGIWSETDSNIFLLNPSGTKRSTGYSINADGTYVSIGGMTGSTTGTVNILTRTGNTFALQQTITPNDAPKLDFGWATALNYDGDKLLVGESSNVAANTKGNIYYFTRSGNTWTQQQKFTWSGANISPAISIQFPKDDTKCIVTTGQGSNTGAYYFTRSGNTWTEQQKYFTGASTSIISGDANTIAVSSSNSIRIFEYTGSNFNFTQTITNPYGANLSFGVGVSTNFDGSMICTGSTNTGNAISQYNVYTIVNNDGNYEINARMQAPFPYLYTGVVGGDNNWLVVPVDNLNETYIFQRI